MGGGELVFERNQAIIDFTGMAETDEVGHRTIRIRWNHDCYSNCSHDWLPKATATVPQ
jgi:hypothetical protein